MSSKKKELVRAIEAETGSNSPVEEAVDPPNWKELEELYGSLGKSIGNVGNFINNLLNTASAIEANIPNVDKLNMMVKGFSNDLVSLSNRLRDVFNQHSQYSGIITEAEDYALYFKLISEYTDIDNTLIHTIVPLSMEISVDLTNAIKQRQLELKGDNDVESSSDNDNQKEVNENNE